MKIAIILLGLTGLAASALHLYASDKTTQQDLQTTYWPSGKPQSEFSVHDGQREGPARRWTASGQLLEEGSYHEGRMSGQWNFWGEDGLLDSTRSGEYEDGKLVTAKN